jgi:hypothetical protein
MGRSHRRPVLCGKRVLFEEAEMSTEAIERWTPTDAEYYSAHDWLSHSSFKIFCKSPKAYERHIINGVPIKPNTSMQFGSEVDAAVFHPGGIAAGMAIAGPSVLSPSGRRVGKAYKAFVEANAGREIVKHDEPLARVITALGEHAEAMGLLDAEGEAQPCFRWVTDVDGEPVQRRAKLDKLPKSLAYVCDLKTAREVNAEDFSKAIISLGYHTQGSWYLDAVEAHYGVRPPFYIVAVQNCEPFDVEVYKLSERFLELGRQRIETKLREFVACRKQGQWRRESHGKVLELDPPAWAEKNMNDWSL